MDPAVLKVVVDLQLVVSWSPFVELGPELLVDQARMECWGSELEIELELPFSLGLLIELVVDLVAKFRRQSKEVESGMCHDAEVWRTGLGRLWK